MMYEAFFKFRSRPFLAGPQTANYYPASVIEAARKTLTRSIERAEGPGLIVGPAGTGKTLLCHMLAEQFSGVFSVALLSSGRLGTRQAMLQSILYELRLPYRGMDEGELRLALLDHLEPTAEGNEGLLLIIDEADALPWRVLEEVRLITNLVRRGLPRVRVVLAGNPTIEERFASPRLNSFSQRLAARCYLESLDAGHTADYVRAQISAVGGDARLFRDEALSSVYRATDGIPRLINQVCDHALILASLGGLERLTSEAIEEAWADLQQLPAPWNTSQKGGDAPQVIEFGGLSDLQDDPPEAIPFRSAEPRQMPVYAPEEDLDAPQDQFANLDDEFEPAGSIGATIELDFPEFGDPLGEAFAEEEIVLQRYSTDAEIFACSPRVSCWEGQQLGSLLEPVDAGRMIETAFDRVVACATAAVALALASDDLALQARFDAAPLGAGPSSTSRAIVSVPRTIQVDDADLIIIEDTAAGSTWPAPPRVRKLEYRQLFAKLRRG